MKSNESVFVTKYRSAYGPFCLVFLAFLVLLWGSSFDGPTVRISSDYWRWVAPMAIPAAIFIAWTLKRAFVGSWYKPRYAREEHQMGVAQSWATGAIAAAILALFGTSAFANVMNQVIGVPYDATYDVTAKYVTHGKHTCYGLTLTRVGDSLDQFRICVPQSEQDATGIGDILQVKGQRSRFVNQMLSYTRGR
ncbi:hypothetical protein P3T23_008453 [Paraburkholderia sp. GAS448]|uniref:hypothetical protein n=1 Tax=Paraburkholderia sp. GAS448 TaxID=3035136 RepID=UPI003D1D09AA